MAKTAVRRALISVSDKSSLEKLATGLAADGVQILSTGGTAAALRQMGVSVTDVAEQTGFPEIMGGRVKTLHPKIHGGILARDEVDQAVAEEHGIEPIDLVVVNLYPFEATVASGAPREQAVEQIDIGGPAMLRAAAKNHARVTVLIDPDDYPAVLSEIQTGGVTEPTRRRLAAKAFAHAAAYDAAIAAYLIGDTADLPARLTRSWTRVQVLRYGENPHQPAAVYAAAGARSGLAACRPLQGKAISYNNLADADAALACVAEFDAPTCVIVKHANPCGVAESAVLRDAYAAAFACDPQSAFGGIIAFNRPLDGETAAAIAASQFVEVIVAPDFEPAAREVFAGKPNVRLLPVNGALTVGWQLRSIDGGILVQASDTGALAAGELEVVSSRKPSDRELADLEFAWRTVKHVRSNAIVLAHEGRTVGIGAGQTSRVMSVRIAAWRLAELEHPTGAPVLASDAFFPFRDGVDQAAECGATAIIQPGGSRRDDEVISAADEHGMAMVFTGVRHFRH